MLKFDGELAAFLFPSSIPRPSASVRPFASVRPSVRPHLGRLPPAARPRIHPDRKTPGSERGDGLTHKHLWQFNDAAAVAPVVAIASERATEDGHLLLISS